MSNKAKTISFGVLLGVLPTIGLAWAFAVTAADYRMSPHLASARDRVAIMCVWAEIESENTQAICAKVGAACRVMDKRLLLAGCVEKQ